LFLLSVFYSSWKPSSRQVFFLLCSKAKLKETKGLGG
jgi:hypothetical protein